ncbi:unnamed protein product [Urochloa humidicola]
MYVLEGVTPCIQSMKLQAGDIVTFSRSDPEGKLIMGFRKATNLSSEQEQTTTKPANGAQQLQRQMLKFLVQNPVQMLQFPNKARSTQRPKALAQWNKPPPPLKSIRTYHHRRKGQGLLVLPQGLSREKRLILLQRINDYGWKMRNQWS